MQDYSMVRYIALLRGINISGKNKISMQKLKEYSKELKEQVQAKDARLQEVGYQNY